MSDMMAVRTRFFDEFFIQATKSGIRQVAILTRSGRRRIPAALAGRDHGI